MIGEPTGSTRLSDAEHELIAALSGSYTIERELHGGGMSRVFMARERALDRNVVVKVLPSDMAAKVSTERFKREISVAARLQHAHIVPLISAGEADGVPYFTMPFVEGESLRARLAAGQQLPLIDAVRILREVASALAHAHANGIVHRDIKPDNVLLSGGAAMVTDFGVSKAMDVASTTGGALTTAGVALGTPAYMAPEQILGDAQADHRVDIYAWGVMTYELVAGEGPFGNRPAQALIVAHMTESPAPLGRRMPRIPGALADIVMRALAKKPEDRPQSASEIVAVLDRLLTTGVTADRRPIGRMIAAAAAVVLLGIGAVWGARHVFAPATAEARTLAVLPIENIGGDSAVDYLADGMTGELANALRKLPDLQVAGDVSTQRFRNARVAPAEIGRQLGVGLLLTGRLQPGRGRLRLQMQLTKADGKLLWSNTYDRENKDNFQVQDEITRAVAEEMRVVLSPTTIATTRAGRTVSSEAHDLFLRAQFEKNKFSETGLRRSLVLYRQALAIDSGYAQAWAGLSQAYDLLADVYADSHEYHLLSKDAAMKAVAADSMLAEGRVLLGFEIASAEWDFPRGDAEMKRGLALNPQSPDALLQYGIFLFLAGRWREAVDITDRLIRIDPLSAQALLIRGTALLWGEQWAKALAQDSAMKKLDPSLGYGDAIDGSALRELGHLEESLAAYQSFEKTYGQPMFGHALTLARMHRTGEALSLIHEMERLRKTQWIEPTYIAIGYAGVGDFDHALAWIDTAVAHKTFSARFWAESDAFWFGALRSDPRYQARMAAVRARKLTN